MSTRKRKPFDAKKMKFLISLAYVVLLFIAISVVGVIIVFAGYSRDLPNPNSLLERSEELSTKLYDRNGTPILEVYGEKNRILVNVKDVSQHVIHATLSVEDSNFYIHKGFSPRGMLRAVRNMLTGEGLQSGSTITQQAVKNALLTQDRTISRKIKEIILALQLESKYTKDQIIQMYLNETPYGGQNYGIYTAAKAYFNKDPKDLSIAESAYMAGLPQSPSFYSYFGSNPEAGMERKNYVLYLMNERGWIQSDGKRYYLSDEDYEVAKAEELKFQAAAVSFEAPHFVLYVKQLLADMFGEEVLEQGGLQVTTTLDLELQKKAQDIVFNEVEASKAMNVGNGALVALDSQTGQVLAMVGSKGYFLDSEPEGCTSGITGEGSCTFEPNLNVALSKRQPGSAIKPITYATLLSKGYTVSYPFIDVETSFEGSSVDKPYIPENYDGKFRGPMSLRKSLGNSLNIPAVKALKLAGIDSMIDLAESMGITTFGDRSRFGLALTLGGGEVKLLELTGAFSVFPSGGTFRPPTPLLEVKDARGNVLYKYVDTKGNKVLDPGVAFLISDVLSDDGARAEVFGTGSLLNIPGHKVAVKTGTTDDKRDNYAIGFTPSVTVGVWVGNNNNDKMDPYVSSGVTGATPIWRKFMIEYLSDKQPQNFNTPDNVHKVEVDELTGMKPFDDFKTRNEWFIKGTEPVAKSDWYQKIEVCEEDGLIASDSCRDADDTEEKTFIKITAELPEWQNAVDKWVNEKHSGDEKYFPPTMVSGLEFDSDGDVKTDVSPKVGFVNLTDNDRIPLVYRIQVEVSSPNDIDRVKIYIGDNKVTEDKSYPYGFDMTFKPEDAGKEVKLKAIAIDDDGRDGEKVVTVRVGLE
jgi:membrane peptidoglycan carboxypeptidase